MWTYQAISNNLQAAVDVEVNLWVVVMLTYLQNSVFLACDCLSLFGLGTPSNDSWLDKFA